MYKILTLLNLIGVLSTVTHLVLQNNDIYTKERSEYDLKEYSSLQKVLEQDELVRNADILLNRLEVVKRIIVDDAPLLNTDDRVGENDCLESGLLSDFDFSILPALEKEHEGYSRFEQYMCIIAEEVPRDTPDCTETEETFFVGDYRHIPGVKYITETSGSPAYSLLPFLPSDDIALFGHCLHHHLDKDSTNWHVYFGASFYWRLQGNDVAARECIFRSLYYAQTNREYTDGPLVTLANLLSNAGHDSDAALVMEHTAMTPFLRQLKLWSAGNLYTLSEQYKLSLDLYNETLRLGPFPLADERLQTMECYSSIILRMEKQNNVLRATLHKLRERHELETQYIGIQERMFSNLNNSTLPVHIVQQITNTEEAVRNTHKLVLEQQEIQNTLSPTKFQLPADKTVEVVVDDLEKLLETKNTKKQKPMEVKKDLNWIKSTRLKLEELVEQIKSQLSDPTDIPIIYTYEDGSQWEEDLDDEERERRRQFLDEEEERLLEEFMLKETEVIPPKEFEEDPKEEQIKKPNMENLDLKLAADIFPNKEQVKVQFKNFGTDNECEVARSGENDSWYHLKCKITSDVKHKLDKELKIVIREESASTATIELISDGNPEIFLSPHVHHVMMTDKDPRRFFTPFPKIEKPHFDDESLTKLITEHLQTRDIFRTMKQIRKDTIIKPNAEKLENAVEIDFGEESWVLRLYKVDTSPTSVVRIEQCDQYIPVFSHGDPYVPLMTTLLGHHTAIQKALKTSEHYPFSPDCTAHMDLDNCFLCYDDLTGVNREEYDTRHILEEFAMFELELIAKDVASLGAAIDSGLRKDPNNWLLYHLAATFHRTYTFDIGPAMQCTRRALAVVDIENRPVPLLTLTNLLHQGRSIPDATVVVLELLATDPNLFLHHIEASILQVAIGKPSGQFRAALDALNLSHSPLADHLLNSLLCYYDILKEAHKPPYARFIHSKSISRNKRHPPFTKPHKAPIDGEIWRLEHHEGITVDVTWVK